MEQDVANAQALALLQQYERARLNVRVLKAVLGDAERAEAELERDLEMATRPLILARVPDAVRRESETQRVWQPMGYRLGDRFVKALDQISLYVSFMRDLFLSYPDRHAAIERALSAGSRTRRHVARRAEDLYSTKSAEWATGHSTSLVDGWFIDTNLNLSTKRRNIGRASRAVGLIDRLDYQVFWAGYWIAKKGTDKQGGSSH